MAASSLENTPVLAAITDPTAATCLRARSNATCTNISDTLPSCRNAFARETPALLATTSICTALIPRAAISASAALIKRSFTVPSSPEVGSTAVTALRLRDGTGDLQFDQPVVVDTQLAQHLVGVLGELRSRKLPSPLQLGRVIVEPDGACHQLLRIALGINDGGDPAVRGERLIVGHLPSVLDRRPLSGSLAQQLFALGEAQLGNGVVNDAVRDVGVLGHRFERLEPGILGVLIQTHQQEERRPVPRGLQHRQLDEPAVRSAVCAGQRIARGLCLALDLR